MFDEVIGMLENLLTAWKKIACADVGDKQPALYGIPTASAKGASRSQVWSA